MELVGFYAAVVVGSLSLYIRSKDIPPHRVLRVLPAGQGAPTACLAGGTVQNPGYSLRAGKAPGRVMLRTGQGGWLGEAEVRNAARGTAGECLSRAP